VGAGATRSNAATTATVTLQVIVTGDNGHVSVSAGADCDIVQTRDNGQSCRYSVTAGDQVTLRPATTTGFVGWSVFECPGTTDCTITMDSDRTVVATFTPTSLTVAFEGNDPAETVTSSDGLISCPAKNCSSGEFPAFGEVTLTAAPADSFESWSGACQEAGTQPTCTLLLSGDDVVGAKFKDAFEDPQIVPPRQDMLLSVVVEPKGSGTVTSNRSRLSQAIDCSPTCQAKFEQGESPTLTAVGLNGGTFVGWRGGGRFCKADSTCHFPAFSITDIEAVFKPAAGCVVPRVVGLRLKKAKQRISKALCSTGKVTRKPSSLRKKGRVLAQSPRPHTKLNQGARVKLVVGRGRH
jgi:PASTA domain/Divergent InlB B-repeat domain